jgi:hypothetical protein
MNGRLDGSQSRSKYGNISRFRVANLTPVIRSHRTKHVYKCGSDSFDCGYKTPLVLNLWDVPFYGDSRVRSKNFQSLSSVLWQLIADCPQNDTSLSAASSTTFQLWNYMFSVVCCALKALRVLEFFRELFFSTLAIFKGKQLIHLDNQRDL